MVFAVVRRGKRPAADKSNTSAAESALLSIQTYFDSKADVRPETEEQVFGKLLAMELAKIQDDNIKQRIKRRLLDVVYEGVDEYRQQSKQQPVPPVNVQYMVVSQDGNLQLLTSPES